MTATASGKTGKTEAHRTHRVRQTSHAFGLSCGLPRCQAAWRRLAQRTPWPTFSRQFAPPKFLDAAQGWVEASINSLARRAAVIVTQSGVKTAARGRERPQSTPTGQGRYALRRLSPCSCVLALPPCVAGSGFRPERRCARRRPAKAARPTPPRKPSRRSTNSPRPPRVLTGPAGNPECVWLGRRVVEPALARRSRHRLPPPRPLRPLRLPGPAYPGDVPLPGPPGHISTRKRPKASTAGSMPAGSTPALRSPPPPVAAKATVRCIGGASRTAAARNSPVHRNVPLARIMRWRRQVLP